MAEGIEESKRLQTILEELKGLIIHRAVVAWERSPETFSDEVVALNDVNDALDDIRGRV
ncbi:MAG: hypothetical protein JRM80_03280 [Nitrososphaerota archaeon]|nr:hypothetical protein [Nitrososphaerota archaeon]